MKFSVGRSKKGIPIHSNHSPATTKSEPECWQPSKCTNLTLEGRQQLPIAIHTTQLALSV
ncbi:hypothetical protein E2C01_000464 [Portunus trituberculatus]|uniref:Uncharacterized protein n=1 Tax=Portunus trituberculatus TaxID=210409 RepID=A0A5B7CHI2_PORTR|nr:hypothetical protein [Portunus trituberculatus]